MKSTFKLVFVLMLALALPETGWAGWSDWLTKEEFEREFRYQASRGRYPQKVSASAIDGEVYYRGDFIRTPSGRFRFASHHGVGDRQFEEYNYLYEDRDYELIWHARFRYDGRTYNQGVWVQRR